MIHQFEYASKSLRGLRVTVRASWGQGVVDARFPKSGNRLPDSMLCRIRDADWDQIEACICDCEEQLEIDRADFRRGER